MHSVFSQLYMDIVILVLYVAINVINLGIAISILASADKNRTNILFFWTLFTLVLWNVTLFLSLPLYPGYTEASLVFFARCAYGFSILENMFVILFTKEIMFPLNEITLFKKKLKISKWVFRIIALEASIFFLLCVTTPLLYEGIKVEGNAIVADYFGPLYDWYSIHFILFTILPIAILFIKSRQAKGIIRKKLFLLLIGFATFHIIATIFNIILPALGNPSYYLVGGIAFGLFGGFTLYIVFKYRFLGTKLLLWKSSKIILQILIVALLIYLTKLGISTSAMLDSYDYLILPAVGILSFILVSNFFLKDFYMGRSYNNFQNTVGQLIESVKGTTTLKEFRTMLASHFSNKLHIEKAELYVIEDTLEHVDIASYPQNELTAYLGFEKKEIVAEEWKYREVPLTPTQLKALVYLTVLDAQICIPLFHQNKLIGLFILGAKTSQEPYYSTEIDQLKYLGDYISAFIVNVSLFQQEQQTKEELEKTKELASSSTTARRLMHDMKNSLQSAYAVIREVKESKDIHKVGKVEEKLWDLEDSLSSRDNELQEADVDLYDFLTRIAESFKELFKEKSIEYTYKIDIPPKTFIRCDRKKYKSIFDNLLHNASKFTPEGGKVIFRALQNVQDTELLVTISNTGEGIPEEEKEKIFEAGFTKDKLRGTGLGLSVVKKFVELHNGEIHEFGTAGKDTVFTIRLPIVVPDIVIFDRKKK